MTTANISRNDEISLFLVLCIFLAISNTLIFLSKSLNILPLHHQTRSQIQYTMHLQFLTNAKCFCTMVFKIYCI